MIRAWLAISLVALTVVAAKAIPASQQIIIFGGGSNATGGGGGGGGCTINGSLDFSGASSCNMIFYMTGVIQ